LGSLALRTGLYDLINYLRKMQEEGTFRVNVVEGQPLIAIKSSTI
jgi:hypothetical protein